jgi:hypothetical protein
MLVAFFAEQNFAVTHYGFFGSAWRRQPTSQRPKAMVTRGTAIRGHGPDLPYYPNRATPHSTQEHHRANIIPFTVACLPNQENDTLARGDHRSIEPRETGTSSLDHPY